MMAGAMSAHSADARRPSRLIRAAWVAPMNGPVVRDGGVVVRGTAVRAVGPAAGLRRGHPDAVEEDLGAALLLPGLVNAHTHLELTDLKPGPPPATFTGWLKRMISELGSRRDVDEVLPAAARGTRQCLRFGSTTAGNIVSHPAGDQAVGTGVRGVSFREVRGMAGRRGQLQHLVFRATIPESGNDKRRLGISPHAPYSVEIDGYRRCLSVARQLDLSLATHLAESPDEGQFLAEHTGPFRDLWEWLGMWDDRVPKFAGGPIRFAEAIGLLDYPSVLAHVNYCDDAEMDLLAAGRASVVYCPRTHAYFGHPPHRWREMLARGINVAVGTDSCASSPDLNLVDDLRLVHRLAPDVPAATLWEMATVRGARALRMDDQVGTIGVGKAADLVAFAVSGYDDPLTEVLEAEGLPLRVWVAGEPVGAPARQGDRP